MKLYIETSVPNMLFAEDAPEKRAATEVFFEWLRVTDDDLFSSQVVKKEIDRAPEPKRTRMIQAFAGLPITVLDITDKAVGLATCTCVKVSRRCVTKTMRCMSPLPFVTGSMLL
jgi:hypothetical protein